MQCADFFYKRLYFIVCKEHDLFVRSLLFLPTNQIKTLTFIILSRLFNFKVVIWTSRIICSPTKVMALGPIDKMLFSVFVVI